MPAQQGQAYTPEPLLTWVFQEHWWGETARWASGEWEAGATDMDGDRSAWFVKRDGIMIASGKHDDFSPYHFDAAMESAALALHQARELSAASDYALDGMARSYGIRQEAADDVDWSRAECHAYWLAWHMA